MTPRLRSLIRKLRTAAPAREQLIKAYLAVDAAVEAEICIAKSRVLKSAIAWGGEGQELATQARDTALELARLGVTLVGYPDEEKEPEAGLHLVIQAALANFAAAARWSAMVRRGDGVTPDFREIHALYRCAERLGIAFAPGILARDGFKRALTTEAHYLRALVMPVFCDDTLDPQQLEIVDSWLWEWVGDYRLTREIEGGEARLWVDLDGANGVGLRQFQPGGREVRHLVLARLCANIRAATASFRAGRIYAATPVTAEFAMESHVSALDHVQQLWDRLQDGAPKRRHERRKPADRRVQSYLGLSDLLGRGFGHAMLTDRYVEIRDESDCGASIFVDPQAWDQIWHGDLIGLRAAGEPRPRVGVVRRKFTTDDGGTAIGIEWVAVSPRILLASEIREATGTVERRIACLYVAGDEESGRKDRILVDDSAFLYDNRYELAFEDRVFEVRLNRVLMQGRGWVTAGFEVVGSRRPSLIAAHA